MAKIDFSKYGDLEKLKNEVNRLFEERMRKAGLNEELETLHEKPFGAIKNVFEGLTDKLYESAEGKKLIGKYVKAIREGKNSSDMYSVYEFVYRSPKVSDAGRFLNEAISMTNGFDGKKFADEKKKIAGIVAEAVSFAGKDANFVKDEIAKNLELNEAIDYLISNEKKFNNLSSYVNKFSMVERFLSDNMVNESQQTENKSGKDLIADLNESMEGLNEWEKEAVKEIAIARLSKRDMSEIFEEKKTDCLNKLDENIENEDSVETKSHFETMRSQLEEKKYNEDTVLEDIITLVELKKTLSE